MDLLVIPKPNPWLNVLTGLCLDCYALCKKLMKTRLFDWNELVTFISAEYKKELDAAP
jgi:hypothetical protein